MNTRTDHRSKYAGRASLFNGVTGVGGGYLGTCDSYKRSFKDLNI